MKCEATFYQQILPFLDCQPVPFVVVAFVVWCFNCAMFNYFSYAKMYCSIGYVMFKYKLSTSVSRMDMFGCL